VTELAGVLAKLDRADEHVEEIHREVARFLYGKPYEAVLDYDAESVAWIVRMRIHREIPLRIATITGDCVHNLRSALDQLVYALVEKAGGKPTKRTRFPIFTTQTKWADGHAAHTKGLSAPMLAEVDALQPYHGGHKASHPSLHPLHLLDVYWNWDKHNVLLPTWGSFEGLRDLLYSPNDDCGEWVSQSSLPWGQDVQDGTEIFRVTFRNPGPSPEMEMHRQVSFDISLGSGPPLTQRVSELAAYVRVEVLPRFERFS
jgi:hypothetical protein